MADVDVIEKTGDHLDTAHGDRMRETVDFFAEHSRIKSNGLREVPKDAYMKELGRHGVTKEILDQVSSALAHTDTAAADLAARDLENKLGEATDEQLADENYRKGMSSTVRLPTYGGSTDITVSAETHNNIPFRGGEGDTEGPQKKVTYGRVSTKINGRGRIHKNFHEDVADRMRAALKVKA